VSVVVSGVGVVSALGGDTASTWRAVLAGESAARAWEDLADEGFPLTVACRIDPAAELPPAHGRGAALARRAAAEALGQAGLVDDEGRLTDDVDTSRVGVFVGTTMGESAEFETALDRGAFALADATGPAFARAIAQAYDITGPLQTLGTACAAGNYAIGAAARALAAGRVDIAIAGGVEPFSRIAMLGFARMRAMAPHGCAPFDVGRRGMTLGEGAAVLVLQRAEDVTPGRSLAVVGALGLATDAHHPTAPRDDGRYLQQAMREGIRRTGIEPGDIGWVSAHGTGTPLSDAAEALSLRAVFGTALGTVPPVSSVKGALGHTMGAATAIEAVLAVQALRERMLPPNAGMAEVDPALEVDVVTTAREAPELRWVLNCGFAFGGLNSALVIGRAP